MAYKSNRPRTPEVCPVCGEDVPPRALACPECGADHDSGWKDDVSSDGLDLPDGEFDYNDFVKNEFGEESRRSSLKPIWWTTAVALFALMLSGAVALILPSLKQRGKSAQCINNMSSIGLAARLWSEDHGHLPPDLSSMADIITDLRLWICPADSSRHSATSWAAFTLENSSYEIINPNHEQRDDHLPFLRCKIHNHLGYPDGSVFDGVRRRTK